LFFQTAAFCRAAAIFPDPRHLKLVPDGHDM
jgi:hypothetical protein